MNKTLFSVLLPATGRSYDFWVPDDMPMQKASRLVAQAMEVAEPSFFVAHMQNVLMHLPSGKIQDPNTRVGETGFSDGERFVLV